MGSRCSGCTAAYRCRDAAAPTAQCVPDKISIFGGPITRLAAGDADRLRREVRHVVLHEIAHHFGISDERLIELDRY